MEDRYTTTSYLVSLTTRGMGDRYREDADNKNRHGCNGTSWNMGCKSSVDPLTTLTYSQLTSYPPRSPP
jgi:hypothetical protein